MVLQEAPKEPLSGPGEAERSRVGAGRESRKPFLAWNGMFQKNVFGTSRTRASAAAPLVILVRLKRWLRIGGRKREAMALLSFRTLSLTGRPAHSQDIRKGELGPERMGSLWRKAGVPHPEFIGTTRGGRLGERGSWACVSVSVSRECVGS